MIQMMMMKKKRSSSSSGGGRGEGGGEGRGGMIQLQEATAANWFRRSTRAGKVIYCELCRQLKFVYSDK